MTAAPYSVAPDTPSQDREPFHDHLQPSHVTAAVRHRMAAELTYEQATWSLLIACTALAFALMVVVLYTERELPGVMRSEAMRTVALAMLFALTYLHLHYRRQRNFVLHAPVTAAMVIREKAPRHFDEASSLAVPRLLLRYIPRPAQEGTNSYDLHRSQDAHTLWADLDGFSASFERTVHPGDLVSLLYDTSDPAHVRVVEIERHSPSA